MSAKIEMEMISRRRAFSILGAALGLAVLPTILTVSEVEAQPSTTTPQTGTTTPPQTGTERRLERRRARTERRQERRTARTKRRKERRTARSERREERGEGRSERREIRRGTSPSTPQ